MKLPKLRGLAVAAATVLLLGVAFCFVMYWWQLRYEFAVHDPAGNLLLAIPFAGLAAMVACGMGRVATIVSWLILAMLTGSAYISNATSESSTAAIAFVAPFMLGGTAVCVIFAFDRILLAKRQLARNRGT